MLAYISGNLKSDKWHYLVVHVKPSIGSSRTVDLYINCERVASRQSPFGYQNAIGDMYEMNIGQRGLRHLALARWKVQSRSRLCTSPFRRYYSIWASLVPCIVVVVVVVVVIS